MKKIIVAVTALLLMAGTTAFATDKKPRKKAKAKKECKMADCKVAKGCTPSPDCPVVCLPPTCSK